jgi:hypothetical protein
MEKLGIKCQQIDNGMQTLPSGKSIPLPPVLFGTLGNDPKKKVFVEKYRFFRTENTLF